jgi:hypothetical protein
MQTQIFHQGLRHTMALPFYIEQYLNAKEELWKLKYISPRVASHYGLAILH